MVISFIVGSQVVSFGADICFFFHAEVGIRVVTVVHTCAPTIFNWKPCGLLWEAAKQKTEYEKPL